MIKKMSVSKSFNMIFPPFVFLPSVRLYTNECASLQLRDSVEFS